MFGDLLKKVAEAKTVVSRQKAEGVVLPLLDAFLLSLNNVYDGREPGFHCSQMWKCCPRMLVLAKLRPKPESRFVLYVPEESEREDFVQAKPKIEAKSRRVFDLGTAIHDLFQNKYLAPAGLLWGRWTCSRCEVLTPEEQFMPQIAHCPRGTWIYDEPPVLIKEQGIRITGHADGILMIRGRKMGLEIKSIKPGGNKWASPGFAELKEPKPEHEFQLQLYLSALNLDSGVILYMCKGTQEMKEYVVQRSEAARKEAVRRAVAWVRIQKGVPTDMPDRICESNQDSRAKYDCAWSDLCFNDMLMGTLHVAEDPDEEPRKIDPDALPF